MTLSISDYLFFSNLAYSNESKNEINGILSNNNMSNWSVIDIENNENENGFYAIAFGQDTNNDGKYDNIIIAYRGTNSVNDILNDDWQIFQGNVPANQLTEAFSFYYGIKYRLDVAENSNFSLTGHSLGGALAQIVGVDKQINTITFNAPGMQNQISTLGYNSSLPYEYITNYIIMNDYVGNYGEHVGNEYYYEPIPIDNKTLTNTIYDTHNGILPSSDNNIDYDDYLILPETFGQNEGLSLWYYDINNVLNNDITYLINAVRNIVSAGRSGNA